MEEEILENANESLESGEDDLKKNRFNAAVASFFRAIVNFTDYIIYKEIKINIKNHAERFSLLNKYFPEIHEKIRKLFEKYKNSYKTRLTKQDVVEVRRYAYELKNTLANKK